MMKLVRSRKKETSIFSPRYPHFFLLFSSFPPKTYEVTENLNIIQIGSNYYDSYYPSATSPKSDQDLIVSGSEQTEKKVNLCPKSLIGSTHHNRISKVVEVCYPDIIKQI